jgi:Tol biopolymer transport system component
MTPKIFAPGIISTGKEELNLTISPNGKEILFTETENRIHTIMTIKMVNGVWTSRKPVSFSGKYSDVDPFFSRDGKRIYFSSHRPIIKNDDPKDSDLWYVEKKANGRWGEPVHISSLATSGKHDFYTSISDNGNLYFSIFEDGFKGGNIYKTKMVNGKFEKSVMIKNGISSIHTEHDPYIAKDESFLLFTSNRPGGIGSADIYISFKDTKDDWSKPINLGKEVNSSGYDYCPMVSTDGKYFFFTRNNDIWWVDIKFIDKFKKKHSNK